MITHKIYSTDKTTLDKVCSDYRLTPEYLYRSWNNIAGEGYCVVDGQYLRGFTTGSHVDMSSDIQDITEDYITKEFIL